MTARKPAATENQVTQQVHDAAALFGLKLERRNVMAAANPAGRLVRSGEKGEADWTATVGFGPHRGRRLSVEVKRGDFDPRRLRGKAREHFARQVAHLKRVNAEGGLALWVRSGEDFAAFLRRVQDWPTIRVEFDADWFPWMTDDPEALP